MANRDALRDLQNRLATRLQAARDEGLSVSWLAVDAGSAHYLFPLAQAGEIFPWSQIQPVPYTRGWFLGVANLRGGLFGVVDWAEFVATTWPHSGAAPVRTEQALSNASLLALSGALDVNAVLLLDNLVGLRGSDAFIAVEPSPQGAPEHFGALYIDSSGERWQEINLQMLAQYSSFLSISA